MFTEPCMKVIDKNSSTVQICADFLNDEKVLILPTDTVYGFSGIIDKTEEKIRAIKGRDDEKPFIVLIAKPQDVYTISDREIPPALFSLWPGALTIIVPDKTGQKTVAVRCPGDEWLRSVIEVCGSPIYSTSVNRSGLPVITRIDSIIKEFEEEVDLIVDNGDCNNHIPSTIVSVLKEGVSLVRQGSLFIPKEILK